MENTKNKNVTISISDDVKSMGLTLAKDLLESNNLSGVISYLIKSEYKKLKNV
ncbi:MAG: hypothetical protein IH795_08580 [Bacteroidetes bacterium]|nr:hypothetical protein [Bacteroidota bacterium]